jgi:hypothetical protein
MSAFWSMAHGRASFVRHAPKSLDTLCSSLTFLSVVKPTLASPSLTYSSVQPGAWILVSTHIYLIQLMWDCPPWMPASTKTARTSLEPGKPSMELLEMAHTRVVFPRPTGRTYSRRGGTSWYSGGGSWSLVSARTCNARDPLCCPRPPLWRPPSCPRRRRVTS